MNITKTLAALQQPPPRDARIVVLPGEGRIRVVPYRAWWFLVLVGTPAAAMTVLAIWLMPMPEELREVPVDPVAYRLGILALMSAVVVVVGLAVFWFMRWEIETIELTDEWLTVRNMSVLRVPVSSIVAVRNAVGKNMAMIDASTSWWHIGDQAPRGSVDVLTADGPVRVLTGWNIRTTRWVAGAIASALDRPTAEEWNELDAEPDEPRPLRPVYFTGLELTLWSLPVVIPAVVMLVQTWHVIRFGGASEHWPVTQGVVRSCRYKRGYAWGDVKVDAAATYAYTVDGESFENDCIWYGFHNKTPEIRALFYILQPGGDVQVRYDPAQPGRSVLIAGYDPALVPLMPLVALFTLPGLAVLVYHPSRARRDFTRRYYLKRHRLHWSLTRSGRGRRSSAPPARSA